VDLKFIRANILGGLKPGRIGLFDDNRSDVWFTKEELDRLFPHILEHLRDLFEFRMWTGARPEEAARFGEGNVNWKDGKIWIQTVKQKRRQGGAIRKRYLTIKSLGPKFEALLRRLTPHATSKLYFARPETGEPYCERHLLRVFQTAVKVAGIVKRKIPCPYDLRGTFAMHRAMRVKNFRQLQAELGHTSPQSIQNYLDEAKHFKAKDSIFVGVKVTAGWED
jgi:integrase